MLPVIAIVDGKSTGKNHRIHTASIYCLIRSFNKFQKFNASKTFNTTETLFLVLEQIMLVGGGTFEFNLYNAVHAVHVMTCIRLPYTQSHTAILFYWPFETIDNHKPPSGLHWKIMRTR